MWAVSKQRLSERKYSGSHKGNTTLAQLFGGQRILANKGPQILMGKKDATVAKSYEKYRWHYFFSDSIMTMASVVKLVAAEVTLRKITYEKGHNSFSDYLMDDTYGGCKSYVLSDWPTSPRFWIPLINQPYVKDLVFYHR